MADYQANLSRLKSDRTHPLGLRQLPLERCEHHLVVKSSDGLSADASKRAEDLTDRRMRRASIELVCLSPFRSVHAGTQQATTSHVLTPHIPHTMLLHAGKAKQHETEN
jgi:hypothetical protein